MNSALQKSAVVGPNSFGHTARRQTEPLPGREYAGEPDPVDYKQVCTRKLLEFFSREPGTGAGQAHAV